MISHADNPDQSDENLVNLYVNWYHSYVVKISSYKYNDHFVTTYNRNQHQPSDSHRYNIPDGIDHDESINDFL